ncbi:MAG TPA: cytochrome c biogenesis protein CcdA [Chryseolinea sp.]|nr:cytochrome c biogenesis protein CcdA [Chryseolinea sp.]
MFIRFARVLFFLVVTSVAYSQILQPARLVAETPAKNLKVGDEVELIFKASVDKGWYIYSVGFDEDCGPIPMAITLEKHPSYSLVGGLVAVNDQAKHDKIFDCDVRIFINTGEFRQKIKVLSPDLTLGGSYEGQVCSEVEGKCVLFSGDLSYEKINVTGKASTNTSKLKEDKKDNPPPAVVQPPAIDTTTSKPRSTAAIKSNFNGPILDRSILDDSERDSGNESLWGYMIVAFILGLTSLITPCVFPMIPMTVTFFLKDDQSKARGVRMGIVFGISIILIYTIVGTAFALLFGAEGLNALATHWLPNLFIFIIFIIFALSFLGLFEITAPHKLVNSADRAAEKGGYAGIFFMSATLVLVSFSCTLPLVGNVLVLAAGGEIVKPIMGMFAYSLAFAIPFTLFAIFPEWLKSLPKSGGWLNSVKVVLGLLELALALKFLSIADQTYHWGLLDRDVNIAIWIVIFSFLGVYLLGRIRMPHDSPVEKVTVPRLMLAILTFSFVVYLVPGLWGAPLKALAGYLPPMHTHDFDLVSMAKNEKTNEICDRPKYAEFLHLPHNLSGYFDYDQAMACALQQKKPLFIDFTGHGCTNCREMEAVVWSDPEVLKRLQNDFVVVALYVDDKTELPESEWYTSKYDSKVKKTIGKQNADLQIANLNNNAQPFYVLVGQDERVLAAPYGYDKSVEGFVNFLEKGKKKYAELYSQ